MPRTGSIGSKVGPAVSSTCLPGQQLGLEERDDVLEQFVGLQHAAVARFRRRPGRPRPGRAARRRRRAAAPTLRCVAGFSHISTFIAGATSRRCARGRAPAPASRAGRRPDPCATLAMKCAVAGATTIASAPRVRSMCGIALPHCVASHWSVETGRPLSACIVVAVTNCRAPSVITTCTVGAFVLQAAHQFADLVGGDSAGHADDDVLAGEFHARYFARRTRTSSSTISRIAPPTIALSAMLKAGQCQPRQWKSRKSITWP